MSACVCHKKHSSSIAIVGVSGTRLRCVRGVLLLQGMYPGRVLRLFSFVLSMPAQHINSKSRRIFSCWFLFHCTSCVHSTCRRSVCMCAFRSFHSSTSIKTEASNLCPLNIQRSSLLTVAAWLSATLYFHASVPQQYEYNIPH